MDQKRKPTRKFVCQALFSDCRVIFARVRMWILRRLNKIEAMYGPSRVSVKVERGLTFTFTSGLSYIVSISFMHVKFTYDGTEKLRDTANQPLLSRARRKKPSNTKRERRAQCPRPTKGKLTSYRVFTLVFLSHLIFSPLSTWLPRSMPAFVFLFVFSWRDLEVHWSRPPS